MAVWSSNNAVGQTPLMDGVPVLGFKFSWRHSRWETRCKFSESLSSLTQLQLILQFQELFASICQDLSCYQPDDGSCGHHSPDDRVLQLLSLVRCNDRNVLESLPSVLISCLGLRTNSMHPSKDGATKQLNKPAVSSMSYRVRLPSTSFQYWIFLSHWVLEMFRFQEITSIQAQWYKQYQSWIRTAGWRTSPQSFSHCCSQKSPENITYRTHRMGFYSLRVELWQEVDMLSLQPDRNTSPSCLWHLSD